MARFAHALTPIGRTPNGGVMYVNSWGAWDGSNAVRGVISTEGRVRVERTYPAQLQLNLHLINWFAKREPWDASQQPAALPLFFFRGELPPMQTDS